MPTIQCRSKGGAGGGAIAPGRRLEGGAKKRGEADGAGH